MSLLLAVVAALGVAGVGPESAMSLSVVTYNIRYDEPRDGEDRWEKRREVTAETIRAHDPDLVGVQEALRHQLDDLERLLPGYAEIGVGREGETRGEYSAILYRSDRFDVLESGTFWFSDTPETPGSTSWGNMTIRICTWAHFRGREGELWMYNTHLDNHSHASRVKSAAMIGHRICARGEGAPVIVTGDFNADENDPAVEAMKDATHGPGLVDTFRVAHPDEKDVGTFNDFGRGPAGRSKIDYIFVSKRVKVVEAGIDRRKIEGRFGSDHFAVWARVEMP